MKRTLIFVGLLAVGYANAQYDGKVGINTEQPKATLDIRPYASDLSGTSNEGIIAPKLSKTRVAGIATPVEGTLVYVEDIMYTAGSNATVEARVAKITEKGYYFYNGTEWVKAGADIVNQLWAQRDNNGITETYLVPASNNNDRYLYTEKGTLLNLGETSRENTRWVLSGNYGYTEGEIPNSILINSSKLPINSTMGNANTNGIRNYFKFNKNISVIKQAHAGSGDASGNKMYVGQHFHITTDDDVTTNISAITALGGRANAFSNSKIGTITAITGEAIAGSDTHSVTADKVAGGVFQGRNFATSTTKDLIGLEAVTHNYGKATNITAGNFAATSSNTHTVTGMGNPTVSITELRGVKVSATNRTNSTTSDVKGVDVSINFLDASVATNGYTINARGYIQAGSTVNNHNNIYSYVRGFGSANVTNLYGFRFDHILHNDFAPTNMYGLYLADVSKGSALNYSIYTNAGQIRFGDLADTTATSDRVVTVDKDGVLKTERVVNNTVKLTTTASVTCDATTTGTMNFGTVTINGNQTEAFGFCMKNSTGEYKWYYIYGGAGITTGSGTFGNGL